jgi:hypothetical protein
VPYERPGQIESWSERQHARNVPAPTWQPLSNDLGDPELDVDRLIASADRYERAERRVNLVMVGVMLGFFVLWLLLDMPGIVAPFP